MNEMWICFKKENFPTFLLVNYSKLWTNFQRIMSSQFLWSWVKISFNFQWTFWEKFNNFLRMTFCTQNSVRGDRFLVCVGPYFNFLYWYWGIIHHINRIMGHCCSDFEKKNYEKARSVWVNNAFRDAHVKKFTRPTFSKRLNHLWGIFFQDMIKINQISLLKAWCDYFQDKKLFWPTECLRS